MARRRQQDGQLREAALMVVQTAFATLVFAIFVLAFLAQGAITLPTWAHTFQGMDATKRDTSAAALLTMTCFIFFLFFGVGLYQMVRQARSGG